MWVLGFVWQFFDFLGFSLPLEKDSGWGNTTPRTDSLMPMMGCPGLYSTDAVFSIR